MPRFNGLNHSFFVTSAVSNNILGKTFSLFSNANFFSAILPLAVIVVITYLLVAEIIRGECSGKSGGGEGQREKNFSSLRFSNLQRKKISRPTISQQQPKMREREEKRKDNGQITVTSTRVREKK